MTNIDDMFSDDRELGFMSIWSVIDKNSSKVFRDEMTGVLYSLFIPLNEILEFRE